MDKCLDLTLMHIANREIEERNERARRYSAQCKRRKALYMAKIRDAIIDVLILAALCISSICFCIYLI